MFSTKHNSEASHVANAQTFPEPAEISNRHFIVRLKIVVTRTKQTSENDSNRNISEGGRESGPPQPRRRITPRSHTSATHSGTPHPSCVDRLCRLPYNEIRAVSHRRFFRNSHRPRKTQLHSIQTDRASQK